MKNEMTLTAGRPAAQGASINTATVAKLAVKALGMVCKYYSYVLGQPVGIRRMLHLLNAQLAFFCTVVPATCPFVVRLLFLFWLLSALLKCKNDGVRTSC